MKPFDEQKFHTKSRVNIEGVILKSLALAGLVTIAVIAPNALQLLKYLDKDRRRKKNPKHLIDEALARLVTKKFISISKNGQLFLTKEGERKLHMIEHGVYPLPKIKWDKKWRIVSFDVSEKRRKSRDKLRLLLRQVGFVRLQDSVWVYPYDVEDVVNLIKTGSFLGKEILYMTVHTTGKDVELKSHFKLS
ncbi:MAG: CRISPR-associated endonuclease Cas2 [Candidatus Pacebacteria bacterium]|nr:CRISPR-associated endonuclease Cas2 [Candidatus Paceibacterota bacterium]MCF7856930.1 CRISPR-associated endonuclease Cas2 [Candidatus Paceibacterota bacterium]